jgi:hypothetical protein
VRSSEEVELFFHFPGGPGGETFFGIGEAVFRAALAFGFFDEVTFTLKAAGGEAGEGVEHAKIVERVGFEGVAEDLRTEKGDGLTDLGGGELLGGLETCEVVVL